jgi:preprotein translocase subunit SecF
MQFLHNPNFDFLGKSRIFLTISAITSVIAVGLIVKGDIHYGVEFSSGTQVIAQFQKAPEVDKIRSAVEKQHPGATIQTYGPAGANQVLIRVAAAEGGNEDLQAAANGALKALGESYAENPVTESSTEVVGPTVGAELRRKAVQLTLFGLLFQLIYIAWRFKGPVWGGAATIAVFHDVLVTLGLMILLKYEITLNVIAALLTLVGYSVNDTIVVFDRVRENLRQRRKDSLAKVINDSINQTLSRTLIASGCTFMTVLGLFILGGEVLRGFAFAMVVGIVVGTYSSIYIASPIVIWWQRMSGRGAGMGSSQVKAAL